MKFVLTGGGSAGHALPSLRLAQHLRQSGADVFYIGAANSIEERLARELDVEFYSIPTGKFDRSNKFSAISAVHRNLLGIIAASKIIRKISPDGIFSSGGFVGVPVVVAGRMAGVQRIIVHACDFSSGLANKLCLPFASDMSCTFKELAARSEKGFFAGPIVDLRLMGAIRERTRETKPKILIYGGSQGAAALNDAVRAQLPALISQFDIMHICGAGKLDATLVGISGCEQHEFVSNFVDVLMSVDAAMSRAGSNSLWELIVAGIPHLAVPLPRTVSRGDQYENCHYFENKGVTRWIEQEALADTDLTKAFGDLLANTEQFEEKRARLTGDRNAVQVIASRLATLRRYC